jgi:hypothetical protein
MDRPVIQQRLAETEQRIASGDRYIAQHGALVTGLERIGRSAAHAKYLLAGMRLLQAARRDSRDWLLKQLDE